LLCPPLSELKSRLIGVTVEFLGTEWGYYLSAYISNIAVGPSSCYSCRTGQVKLTVCLSLSALQPRPRWGHLLHDHQSPQQQRDGHQPIGAPAGVSGRTWPQPQSAVTWRQDGEWTHLGPHGLRLDKTQPAFSINVQSKFLDLLSHGPTGKSQQLTHCAALFGRWTIGHSLHHSVPGMFITQPINLTKKHSVLID